VQPEAARVIADFTSSLYLGIGHPRDALAEWRQLTTGAPAVLGEPPVVRRVAAEFARLVGFDAALAATSTLHIAWDLAELIGSMNAAVLVDHSAYPTLRIAAELARARGAPVRRFSGHDPMALRDAVGRLGRRDARRPLVVITDGFCPMCRRVAPIAGFANVVRDTGEGGFVVIDDTQALGILGEHPSVAQPYGRGGAGTLAWSGCPRDRVMLVASLAKGFGAPLAMLAASDNLLERFAAESKSRTHCSPPSIADLHAAERALAINRTHGDRLRDRLLAVVREFRASLAAAGARLEPGVFPIQSIHAPRGDGAVALHALLARRAVRAVLANGRRRARVMFVLTAKHSSNDIRRAAASVQATGESTASSASIAGGTRRFGNAPERAATWR
jgi:8-amino-7-oxononanoate synthase